MYEEISEAAVDAGWDDDETLPVTIGDLEKIYDHIETLDHTDDDEFNGRNKRDPANTLELSILFDKLSEHYARIGNDLTLFENGKDLAERDDQALIDLFDQLTEYYGWGEGDDINPWAGDLFMVYDALSESFDPDARMPMPRPAPFDNNSSNNNSKNEQQTTNVIEKTIYTKDDEEIKKLYDLIKNGQTLEQEFEGGMIKNFEDLLRKEQSGKDAKMNQLLKEMEEYERQEKSSAQSFQRQYNDLTGSINKLDNEVSQDKKSLSRMEDMLNELIQLQKEQEARDNTNYYREKYGMLKENEPVQNPFSNNLPPRTNPNKDEQDFLNSRTKNQPSKNGPDINKNDDKETE